MEFQFSYPIIFTFISILFVILKLATSSKKSTHPLPPGPWKLPIIGNLHQIIGSVPPHHVLRDLAKQYGPIMHLKMGSVPHVVVTSAEVVKEIFKTNDIIFSNRPDNLLAAQIITYNRLDIGFSRYGSYWRNLRKLCTIELLTAKRVQSFRHVREEIVSSLIKDIAANEGSAVNLTERIFALTNTITSTTAFGRKSSEQDAFLASLKELMKLLSGFSVVDLFPSVKILQVLSGFRAKVEKIHRQNDRILENIIRDYKERKERNDETEENLLDVLLKQQNDKEFPLGWDNIKACVMDIFTGGSETSSTVVDWAMSEMVKSPKVLEKAQAEVRRVYGEKGYVDESEIHQLTYLSAIIKETLRLHPPAVLLLPRQSTERCVISGYEIPAGTKLMVNAWAMGRDPKYWSEAETFKPERFIDNPIDFRGTHFEYIPFGTGRRICPGITFALPNIELPLASFLYHFDWKLPNGLKNGDLDMTEAFAAGVRRKENLCLIPTCYHP